MEQVIKSFASVVALTVAIFLFDFCEILRSGSGLKSKIEFVWGENPMIPSSTLPDLYLPNALLVGRF